MNWLHALLRRARLRGLTEGKVQQVRAEATADDAKDAVERWQDYGFAANPVDGQGLVINVAGHTIVLRMDRITERPELAAHEVCVWHKEGHRVTLKAGRVVDVACDVLTINAATSVSITSPSVTVAASSAVTLTTPQVSASGHVSSGGNVSAAAAVSAGTSVQAPMLTAASSLKVAGKEMGGHVHGSVQSGTDTSAPPT